jgi:hypothetical protein
MQWGSSDRRRGSAPVGCKRWRFASVSPDPRRRRRASGIHVPASPQATPTERVYGVLSKANLEALIYGSARRCTALTIIVLSGQPKVEQEALHARADAFVSKADPPERLLATIRSTG